MVAYSRRRHAEDGESYFVSMTDMMVGLVFIFMIMLMAFALAFQEAQEKTERAVKGLENTNETRDGILLNLQRTLLEDGVNVQIDLEQGILRLPEELLFNIWQIQR